ncbi:MAG: PAS domain S-box protein, partial [Halalkalicoccus sp.]|nr:PAS domain S-box protein [Halalkalicoccus sp.]
HERRVGPIKTAFNRLETVFENANDAVLLIDPFEDVIVDCNPRAVDLLGYPREELRSKNVSDIYPGDRSTFYEFVASVLETGVGRTEELDCHSASGGTIPIETSASVIEVGGRPHVLALVRGRSEREERERELEHYETLVEAVEEYAIFALDTEGYVRTWNTGAERIKGYESDEILGEHVSIFYIDDDREAGVPERNLDAAAEHGSIRDEGWRIRADDSRFWASVTITAIRDDGDLQGYAKIVRDTTERHERERQLRREHDRLSALFENASDPIVEVVLEDETPVIRAVNPEFKETFGYDATEVIDRSVRDVIVPDETEERATHEELIGQILDGESVEAEVNRRTVDGEREFLLRAVPFALAEGMQGAYGILTDISEKKEHERRLETLNEASRELLSADTEQAVADTAVDVIERVFGQSLSAMWLYDDEADRLVPLAATRDAIELATSEESGDLIDAIEPGTAEMDAFHRNETTLLESYQELENPAHPEMPLESRLVEPLGAHGLLAVGTESTDAFDASLRRLVDILTRSTRAALDRLDREQDVHRRSVAMNVATDGMAIIDEDGEYDYVNEAYAALHGYDDPDSLLEMTWKRLYDEDAIDRLNWDALPTVWDRGFWRGEVVGTRADSSTFPQELTLTELDDGQLVCVVRDVTDQKERERQLQALNEVASELMGANGREEIGRIGTKAAERILGFPVACVRLFDSETNSLELTALTDDARELLESRAAYDLEATYAGHALRRGETVINEVSNGDLYADETSYASLHVPLGAYGTLSVISRREVAFVDHDRRLAEVLSVTIETAIAQVEGNRLLRERERTLREQRDQLETLNRINTLVLEIGTRLGEAVAREELEELICAWLADSQLYRSAWIGGIDVMGNRLVVRASTDLNNDYRDAIDRLPVSMLENGTVQEAIETDEIAVQRQYQVTEHGPETDGEHKEDAGGFEAVAAIPLLYGERIYGVLVVNSTREGIFSENALAGFEALGRMVGFAINATKNRELLLSDEIVELEFEVRDSEMFYIKLTEELDCRCRFDSAVPLADGRIINYHSIDGADPAEVLKLAEESAYIEEAHVTSERDGMFVLQTLGTRSPIHTYQELGVLLRSASAKNGTATMILEAPAGANIREIAETVASMFESAELLAKRELQRSVRTEDEFREAVETELTEKQRGALESAFAAGYYDWPRGTTAQELAAAMGVSSSTLHQHLRGGERKLLSAFLDDAPG